MGELKGWQELPVAAVVLPGEAPPLQTGRWRTGLKPLADVSRCVDCLLCWLYCPDAAIQLEGTTFAGIDYDLCKGCEICVDRCPAGALTMVPEETPVG